MAKAAILEIDILAHAEKAVAELDKVKTKSNDSFGALKAVGVAAGAAVAGELVHATEMAADHESSVAKLTQAYRNAGLPMDDMKKSLEEVEASSRRTGQSTEDNIAAYTKLVTATGSTVLAHKDLALAQDLAAQKGISVSDAASMVEKAWQGNTKALKDLGISTKDASGNQREMSDVMAELTAKVHGQADAFGDTAQGQMARFHESMDQLQVKIGSAVIPVLGQLVGALMPIFDWLGKNQGLVSTLVPILAVLGGTVLAVVEAIKIWTAVQTVLNFVLSANPVGLVIVGIVALIGVVILVVTHWRDVLNIVNDVWGVFRGVGDWILAHWKIIVDVMLGPLGLLITNFAILKGWLDDVWNALKRVGDIAQTAIGWLGKIPSGIGGLVGKLNPFSVAPPGGGLAPTPLFITVYATPGDDLPEVVYTALRTYQRRHVRPELAAAFG